MSNFITISEVKSIAFDRNIASDLIPELYITVAQEAHLRPALGDDFFNRLDRDNGDLDSYEVTLKGLIKNALAFYVKYECLPHISMQINNGGVSFADHSHAMTGSHKDRVDARNAALDTAKKLLSVAEKYMDDNATSLTYYSAAEADIERTTHSNGGIILPKSKNAANKKYY